MMTKLTEHGLEVRRRVYFKYFWALPKGQRKIALKVRAMLEAAGDDTLPVYNETNWTEDIR